MNDWIERCAKVNESTIKDRSIYGNKGYQDILNFNFMDFIRERLSSQRTVRILDIGCGNGNGLHELEVAVQNADLSDRVHIAGIGINQYDDMKIKNVELSDVLGYEVSPTDRFDLAVSVFCFHYLPDKLRAIEHVYNHLLRNNGEARLNFPSDLVRLGEQASNEVTLEIDEDERFGGFLGETASNIQIAYEMPTADPYQYAMRCEYGKVIMHKRGKKRLSFPVSLINIEQLEHEGSRYLVSFYQRLDEKAKAPSKK